MKLSFKLLIGLGLTMFLLLIISAFSIKEQYDRIDKNDPFWDMHKQTVWKFKHLKVIGDSSSVGKVGIYRGNDFTLRFADRFENKLKSRLSGDTLIITFNLKKQEGKIYPNTFTEIVLTCPELQSLEAVNQTIDLVGFHQEFVDISCGNNSNMAVEHNKFERIKLVLGENSKFEFKPQSAIATTYDFQPESFDVEMRRNSYLNMTNVLPKKMTLINEGNSVLNLNSATLKLLKN